MVRKLGLSGFMLLIPTLASAGLIYSSTPTTTPATGTIAPKGYVFATNSGTTSFTVTPAAGYAIGTVTLDGIPLAATGLTAGGKSYAVPNKSANQKIVAGFVGAAPPALAAVLTTPLTVASGAPLVISGGASTISLPVTVLNAAYSWSVSPAGPTLSKTSGTTESSAGLNTTFSTATPGVYTVTLALTAPGISPSSATSTVVIQTPALVASKVCLDCHTGKLVGLSQSIHFTTTNMTVGCPSCHNPGLALAHPGNKPTGAGIMPTCAACHNGAALDVIKAPHFSAANASKSLFGQFTSAVPESRFPITYPLASSITSGINPSFVATNTDCSTCHNAHAPTPLIVRQQFAQPSNVHGDAFPSTADITARGAAKIDAQGKLMKPGYDFKFYGAVPGSGITYTNHLSPIENSRSMECVRCHTTTGFINFFTSGYQTVQAWGVAGDKAKEVINCAACHTDTEGTVRAQVAEWTPYLGYSAPVAQRSGNAEIPAKFVLGAPYSFTIASLGSSDVCVSCHSHGGKGKVSISGNLVKKLNTFNSYSVVRLSVAWGSHGTTPAAVPHLTENGFAYKFPGQTYNLGDHAKIGMSNYAETGTAGPCAGCHLNTDKTSVQGGHSFEAWKNFGPTDQYKTVCWKCHMFNPITADRLTTAKLGAFGAQSSVKRVLRKSLGLTATKSLAPAAANPIRFYTGVGSFTYANRANLQGANMNTLMPNNSWWLHGAILNKQVLFDSLDVALHGTITGSIADLSTASAFNLTQGQIDRAIAWFGGTSRPVAFNP
jgi:hypothetical protein